MAEDPAAAAAAAAATPAPSSEPPSSTFSPADLTASPPLFHLPGELWLTLLSSPCTFPPAAFTTVMLDLIANPNRTSSHLFRADIFYDSSALHPLSGDDPAADATPLLQAPHLHPRPAPPLPGWTCQRTLVRQLVPRNALLDRPLPQTCHFYSGPPDGRGQQSAVLYTPHVASAAQLPFYHPPVSRLAFLHAAGSLSLSCSLFDGDGLTPRLRRTALNLLRTVHRHGQGVQAGYQKRVRHDRVLPQKRCQDTYARLKAAYARELCARWVECTDPSKHVFEDLGIAAFLIELWRDMYDVGGREGVGGGGGGGEVSGGVEAGKPRFPGFVDIGCGNGVLVYILRCEGYAGCGFDARARKTWTLFPPHVQAQLKQRLLVPRCLQAGDAVEAAGSEMLHDGVFERGVFIISNHADELTPWTPLLAYLNDAPFIAIPCCSHDLAGARFRAPASSKAGRQHEARLPQQSKGGGVEQAELPSKGHVVKTSHAAETGSLRRTLAQKKMASAYSTLCSYVAALAGDVGFVAETEMLRIPSTRNTCILGRCRLDAMVTAESYEQRDAKVREIVEGELGMGMDAAGAMWTERIRKLTLKAGQGH